MGGVVDHAASYRTNIVPGAVEWSEERQEAAFFLCGLVSKRAFGAYTVIRFLARLRQTLLRQGDAQHMEGLVGCSLYDAIRFIQNLDGQLVRAAINVDQREHRAATCLPVRLAVDQQAIRVTVLQGGVVADADDQFTRHAAHRCVRLGYQDPQELVAEYGGRFCGGMGFLRGVLAWLGAHITGRDLDATRVAVRLVCEHPIALRIDVGIDIGARWQRDQ